jgi:hypothetical protein
VLGIPSNLDAVASVRQMSPYPMPPAAPRRKAQRWRRFCSVRGMPIDDKDLASSRQRKPAGVKPAAVCKTRCAPRTCLEKFGSPRSFPDLPRRRCWKQWASPPDYGAGVVLAITRGGCLWKHESGTYVKFTPAGAELLPRGRSNSRSREAAVPTDGALSIPINAGFAGRSNDAGADRRHEGAAPP